MQELLISLALAVLSTNQPLSNLVARGLEGSVTLADLQDPVSREFLSILAADNAAQAEVDQWIQEATEEEQKGGLPSSTLRGRIQQRFETIRKRYQEFLQRYPKHVEARIAYGSFLGDMGDEDAGAEEWEKAKAIDPTNAPVWNNLGNYYGHQGPVTNAFAHYEKALKLQPQVSLYHHNFATTLFLFRRDAMEHYKITEQEVFDRSMDLYRKALELDPTNFPLATDLAQSYYGIKPPRTDDARKAWQTALKLAADELERQGIYVHLARVDIMAGRFKEAREQLKAVTNEQYNVLKDRLVRTLEQKESAAKAPPAEEKNN